METEIRTIRNLSRCNVFLLKLEQPHRRPARGIVCGPAALPISRHGLTIFIALHTGGGTGCKL